MNRCYRMARTCLLGSLLCLAGTSARAGMSWTVTLDTSQLAANYTGPFGLDFELIGTVGNTVTLSHFSFGGGGSAGPGSAFLAGGASGDLGGSVVLNDSANFLVDFNQQFTPGTMLTFTVDTTLLAPISGGFPDNFSMVIFSEYASYNPTNPPPLPSDTPIPTLDPTGNNTFFNVDINGPGATTALSSSSASGDISITVTPASVPEPRSDVIFILGTIGVAGMISSRRRLSVSLLITICGLRGITRRGTRNGDTERKGKTGT